MLIFNRKYKVEDIDKLGKIYTVVSRAYLKDNQNKELILDYHCVLLKLNKEDIINIQIYNEFETNVKCNYQMNGTIYKIEQDGDISKLHASFGGLLMIQEVDSSEIRDLHDSSQISILISKI